MVDAIKVGEIVLILSLIEHLMSGQEIVFEFLLFFFFSSGVGTILT